VSLAQYGVTAQQHMTTSVVIFALWALLTGAFAVGMTARELNTNRARALRLEDSPLDADAVKYSGAVGLVVALVLCLIASR
jgi:hypothetical protein